MTQNDLNELCDSNELGDFNELNDSNELDCFYDEDCDSLFCDNNDSAPICEWTEEDAWDALTDGMYGDYPGSGGWDSIYDVMGL